MKKQSDAVVVLVPDATKNSKELEVSANKLDKAAERAAGTINEKFFRRMATLVRAEVLVRADKK